MSTHAFDPQIDEVYDSDANPDVYLTEEQVAAVAGKIACDSTKEETAKQYVLKIEEAQRDQCCGRITRADNVRICKELNEKFRAAFGTWVYQSRFAQRFYASFGAGEM